MAIKLKPCPFCGREVEMFGGCTVDWSSPYFIMCECGASSIESDNTEMVAYWWNRRAEEVEVLLNDNN